MNKTELSSAVAKQANLTQAQAKAAVEATLDAIAAAVKEGDKVALLGFGTFSVTERPERQGINPDMYFQITGTTQEDLHKQYEGEAESRTKTNLVIEAVAKAEGFDASEEEIQKEVEQLATDYNMEVAQVQSLLSADMLKHDITIKKAVELITSTATVK